MDKVETVKPINIPIISKPSEQIIETPYTISNKYQYEYSVILNNPGEDGLMDTYLNEANVESEKPRSDPSDWFNFGLDEEKWIKLLNKNILMHYERHILGQDKLPPGQNIPVRNVNPQIGHMPNAFYPYGRPMGP
jgi:hypothetical protein